MEGYDFVSKFADGDSPNKTWVVKASSDSENAGVTQRCILELYQQLEDLKAQEKSTGRHYSVFCSFLQIYNEKVFDLLNSGTLTALSSKRVGDQNNK